jgi:carboxyl-terminal processing protease
MSYKHFGSALIFFVSAASIVAGWATTTNEPSGLVQEAWEAVSNNYLAVPADHSEWNQARQIAIRAAESDPKAAHTAIVEMLAALHNTRLQALSPEELKEVVSELQGDLPPSGLTYLSFEFRPHAPPRIITALESSAAAEAGVKPGDELLAVDGNNAAGMPIGSLLARFKSINQPMQIDVLRDSKRLRLVVKPRASAAKIDAVSFEMAPDKTGKIRIRQFTLDAGTKVQAAVRELTRAGALRLVIDVRNDPGGFISSANEAAGGLIGHAAASCRIAKDGKESCEQYPNRKLSAAPVTILVNHGTASAAEVFAAAFQRNHRGQVQGCKTYGHGLANTLVKLSDGSAVLIPVTRYLDAEGRDLEGHGVIPDRSLEARDCQ